MEISDKMNKAIKSGSSLGTEFNNLYNDFSNCSYKIVSYMEKIKKQIGFMYNICNKLGEKYTEAEGIFKIDDVNVVLFRANCQPFSCLSATFPATSSGTWKDT